VLILIQKKEGAPVTFIQRFSWFCLACWVPVAVAEPLVTIEGTIKTTSGIEFGDGTVQTTAAQGDDLGDHTASQTLDMDSNFVRNVADPLLDQDAATKAYVDAAVAPIESALDALCTIAVDMGKCDSFPQCGGRCNRRVFVTSTTHNGNLGGISGADAICQGLAGAAGLNGTYYAWLSHANDTSSSPLARFTQSTYPYVLVDGSQVAANWTDLTDGTLDTGITLDETGGALSPGQPVWSATDADGDFSMTQSFLTCSDWTADTSESGLPQGVLGLIGQTDSSWTNSLLTAECHNTFHLYCFQQ